MSRELQAPHVGPAQILSARLRRIRVHTISLRTWVLIGIGVSLVRIATAIQLGLSPAPFALDEETYANLIVALESPETFATWNGGFGLTLYPATRAFLFPARVLVDLGLNPLLAVRFIAVTYGLAIFLVFIGVIAKSTESNSSFSNRSLPIASRQTLAIVLLLAWPSLNAWTVTGLKDTTSMFWTLLAIVAGAAVLARIRLRTTLLAAVMLACSIAAILQVRDYLFATVLTSFLIGIAYTVIRSSTRTRAGLARIAILLATTAVGALIGYQISAPTAVDIPQLTQEDLAPSPNQASIRPERLRPYVLPGPETIEALQRAPELRGNLARGAESAIELPIYCPPSSDGRVSGFCEVARLPIAAVYGTFLPLAGIADKQSDSLSYRAAAFENYAWIVLFSFLVLVTVRSRFKDRRLAVMLVAFVAATLLGLAVFSGNSGTQFRHKSQVLVPALLVIAISAPRMSSPPRNRIEELHP